MRSELATGMAQRGDAIVDQIEAAAGLIEQQIAEAIDADFVTIVSAQALLSERRDEFLMALGALRDYELGEVSALKKLRETPAIRDKGMLSSDELTPDDIQAIEKTLYGELENIHTIEMQVDYHDQVYRDTLAELDRVYSDELTHLARKRARYLSWARVHHLMATGVNDPAKWLSVISNTAGLFNKAGWDVSP